MAKQKGFIKLKGSLGGLTFYDKDGKNIVRTTGGLDKSKIKNDPAFKRTRENMREFGAAAQVGKSFRMGFSNIIKGMTGRPIAGRITGLMKRLNAVGPGERGRRSFEILNNKNLLVGLDFNLQNPLGGVFFAPYAPPALDSNRSVVSFEVPDFNTDSFINAPEGATHFKLLLASTILSDFVYDDTERAYVFVNPDENEKNGVDFSSELPLGGPTGSAIQLTVDLGLTAALPNTAAVISAVGIVFLQEINGQFYELASDNAMRIDAIG